MTLEHEEITREIIGAAFEVHRVLGYGFLETGLPESHLCFIRVSSVAKHSLYSV